MKLQVRSPTLASAKPVAASRGAVICWVVILVCSGTNAEQPKPFDRDAFARQARAAFVRADGDGDAQLTLDEFLATYPDSERADAKRRFLIFDFDASGKLGGEEYRTLSAPVDERGDVPDPIVEMETVALAKWEAIFAAADRNRDGVLSLGEWPAKRIAAEIPALAELTFAHWDRQGDGKVDHADGRWLLDVAYGLTQLDGRPLRTKTGRVFSWYYFRHLDSDTDDFVSAYEFGIRHNQGKVRNDEIFAQLDADGDGKLTDRETWSLLWHDTIDQFLDYDRNRDGYLTAGEMLAIGWSRSIARQCVPAFDTDRDGRLSFREFRQTTFANQTSAWPIRHDTDRDSRLSWKEFYTEKPPLLIGQYRFMFDRFDRNHDSFLSILEFTIEGDAGHGQMLAFFQPFEHCLPLEVEFAKRVCKLSNEQSAGLEQAAYNAIERLAEKTASSTPNIIPAAGVPMAGASSRAPAAASSSDMALIHSPHLMLRRELVEWLRDKSAAASPASFDTWRKLDAERLAGEKRRRRAAGLAYVAVLDQVLLLSTTQRSELCDLLEQEADGWWRLGNSTLFLDPALDWFFALACNGGSGGFLYALGMPEPELQAKLTSTQWEVFKRSQQPYKQEIVIAQAAPGAPLDAVPAKRGDIARPAQIAAGGVRQLAQPPVGRRVLRSGPAVEEVATRLVLYVEQRLDDLDAACWPSKAQRGKLSVAARLDLARWRERPPSSNEKLNEGEQLVVQKGQSRGTVELPLAIFSDDNSFFQKAIQSRLTDDQREKLIEADRQRRTFHRQAIVAAAVAGFERTASLTSAQCEALAAELHQSLNDSEVNGAANGYAEWVQFIGRVPFEKLRPLFYDFQMPAAQQCHAELERLIEVFETQRGKRGAVGGAAGRWSPRIDVP